MNFNNSTEKLLFNVLSKFVPAETFQLLQPDNLKKLASHVGATLQGFQETQATILENQRHIMEALNVGDKYRGGGSAGALTNGDGGGNGGVGGGSGDHASGSADGARAA